MIDGVVAIVGRPNVGKSTVFNRIIGERLSIVEDSPGVTRDRIYAKANWLTKDFRLIDTGGIQVENATFQEEIRVQVDIAIDEADVILFIVNGKDGVTDDDRFIARMLRNTSKPIICAVNKTDNQDQVHSIYDFYSLGLDEIIPVSGVHGIGIGDVLDSLISKFPKKTVKDKEGQINFAIIGRPNVG